MHSAPETFRLPRRALASVLAVTAGAVFYALPAHGGHPGMKAKQEVPHPGEKIMLFTGKEEDLKTHWVRRGTDQPAAWKIVEGGAMQVGGGDIATKQNFGDMQLHIEFRVPLLPPNVKGQGRGNSGIGLQGRY